MKMRAFGDQGVRTEKPQRENHDVHAIFQGSASDRVSRKPGAIGQSDPCHTRIQDEACQRLSPWIRAQPTGICVVAGDVTPTPNFLTEPVQSRRGPGVGGASRMWRTSPFRELSLDEAHHLRQSTTSSSRFRTLTVAIGNATGQALPGEDIDPGLRHVGQKPCFGVWCTSNRSTRRRAPAGGKASWSVDSLWMSGLSRSRTIVLSGT